MKVHDDGWITVQYHYRDNGRGPDIDERFRLDNDGLFSEYHVKGTTTFGSKIDEHFVNKGNEAKWWSSSEKGESKGVSQAMYWPLNGTLEPLSVALSSEALRRNKPLTLLPGGQLLKKTLKSVEIGRGKDKRKVQLHALTGVGMTPSFVWTTDINRPKVFAYIYPGAFAAIQKGFESNVDELEALQLAEEQNLLRQNARNLLHRLPADTVIRHVRIFDSENAQLLSDDHDIYLRDGNITQVLKSNSTNPAATFEIDGQHRVALPGLFDMHGHVSAWEGGLNLAAGVTTSRDMGSDNAVLQKLISDVKAGYVLSPDIVPAGYIEGESEFSSRGGFVIKDFDGAKKAIDWYAAQRYPQIKIYNSFPREILRDTVAYAHQQGLRVSGHVPAFLRAQDVIDAGFDEIQHINQLLLNFLVKPDTDTRTLERFYLPARDTAELDFDSKPVQDFVQLLADKKVVVDATLATFDFLRQRDGQMSEAYAAVIAHLPLEQQRARRSAQMDIPDDKTAERYNRSYQKMIEFVGRLYKAGVPLVAGTDELAGFTLHRELQLYVMAGLTPAQALQIATWNGAKYSRVLDNRGSISAGKRADIVLYDGNPVETITDLNRAVLVITQNSYVQPDAVHKVLGIKPFANSIPVSNSAGLSNNKAER